MTTTRLARRHTRGRLFSWGTAFASIIALAAGAVVGGALAYRSILQSALDEATVIDVIPLIGEDRPPVPLPPMDGSKGEPLNILLMGSDVRTGANANIGGDFGGMRNDTTIIMHVSADRSRVEMISIPRDTVVRVPDCYLFDGTRVRGWTGNFNIAFANGGRYGNPAEAAACTQRAVEQLTGIYIHYYAVVDFVGFIGMIDSIGGVPMCIEQRLYAPKAKLDLQPGPQVLDGTTALAYARMRIAEISGGTVNGTDPQRIERQQELLANTAEYAIEQGILFRPNDLREFLGAGAEYMTMSPELADVDFLAGLAFSLRNIEKENIVFVTTPWKYRGKVLGGLEWTSGAYTLFNQVINDQPIEGRSVADASNKADPVPEPSVTPTGGIDAEPEPEPSPAETENWPGGVNPYDLLGDCNV